MWCDVCVWRGSGVETAMGGTSRIFDGEPNDGRWSGRQLQVTAASNDGQCATLGKRTDMSKVKKA